MSSSNWTNWALFYMLLPKNPSYIILNGHKMETELLSYSSNGPTPILPTPPRANSSSQISSLLKSSFSGVQVPKRGCGVGWEERDECTSEGSAVLSTNQRDSVYSILTTSSHLTSIRAQDPIFTFSLNVQGEKKNYRTVLSETTPWDSVCQIKHKTIFTARV